MKTIIEMILNLFRPVEGITFAEIDAIFYEFGL